MKRRTYGLLRDLVEEHGGRMEYLKTGYQWGAWRIELDGRVGIFPAAGKQSFPFDPLFVLKPGRTGKTWHDYDNELLLEVLPRLKAMLKDGGNGRK